MRGRIGTAWLGAKLLVARCARLVFGIAALLVLGFVALQLALAGLAWLKSGTWPPSQSIGEALPQAARLVDGIELAELRRAGAWLIAQSALWAFFALGLVCLAIFGFFAEAAADLDERWQERRYLQRRDREAAKAGSSEDEAP